MSNEEGGLQLEEVGRRKSLMAKLWATLNNKQSRGLGGLMKGMQIQNSSMLV